MGLVAGTCRRDVSLDCVHTKKLTYLCDYWSLRLVPEIKSA